MSAGGAADAARRNRRRTARCARSGLAALVITTSVACSAGDAGGAASLEDFETVTLNVGTLYGPDHWQVTPMKAYTDAVTEESDGLLKFEYHYAGSLAAPGDIGSALESGVLDLAHMVSVYTPETFPIDNWISQAGAVSDAGPPVSALQSAAAHLDWGFSNQEAMDEYTSAGLQPLLPRFMVLEGYDLLCKDEPVTSLDEAAGKRVRVGGPTWIEEADAVGMTPETIVPTEVYEAFQRGLIDCVMAAAPDLSGGSHWEIGKYFTDGSFSGFSSYGLFASKARWDSLPVELQRVMWDNLEIYWKGMFENVLTEQRRFVAEGQERGIEFASPNSDLKEALSEHQAEVMDGLVDSAPLQVSDADALVDDLLERHDKWASIVVESGVEAPGATWLEWVNSPESEKTDLQPWVDRVVSDILEAHRP